MDLTDIAAIKKLCQRYGVRPDPDAGQHFLVNREVLESVVAAADLGSDDTVLEVGPGFGTLTAELAQRARRVIAVELDPKLAAAAREILAPYRNVELIIGNFLRLPLTTYHLPLNYNLVANLPYGITGRLFRRVLGSTLRPQRMVLMVQAEVADRLTAAPGKMSKLAVLCQLHADARTAARVPHQSFWPMPAVDSVVVRLDVLSPAALAGRLGDGDITPEAVLNVAKIGFSARRKTLANNLRTIPALRRGPANGSGPIAEALGACGLPLNARAQELSIVQWITLAKKLKIYLN